MARGSRPKVQVRSAPMLSVPVTPLPVMSARVSSTIWRMLRAACRSCTPLAFSAGGRRERSNTATPISFSSAAICWLTAEGVRFTLRAAAAKLPSSAMASRV